MITDLLLWTIPSEMLLLSKEVNRQSLRDELAVCSAVMAAAE
jgi:hypothetical protein